MDLKDYRRRLDQIDGEILELFSRRMEIAREIGAYKRERDLPVLDAAREREKLQRLSGDCPPWIREESIELFEKIMELSRRVQVRGV